MAGPDDLNLLYNSKSPDDILKFYSYFETRDDLVDWMRKRPDGKTTLFEVEGDSDIVVVIPTADYEGEYARTCRDEIFKGLRMVFVQSGGKDDLYFNIARNVNKGLRKALEYSPRWIIYSNDDVYRIDDIRKLLQELDGINEEKVKAVFTNPPGVYHSYLISLSTPTAIRNLAYSASGKYYRAKLHIDRKYGIRTIADTGAGNSRLFYRKTRDVLLTSDFGIFPADYVRKTIGQLWDETYINGVEDIDQSLMVTSSKEDYAFVNYRIGDLIGSVLGNGIDRELRDRANFVYFNYKIDKGLISL